VLQIIEEKVVDRQLQAHRMKFRHFPGECPDGFGVVSAVLFLAVRMVRLSGGTQELISIGIMHQRRIIICKRLPEHRATRLIRLDETGLDFQSWETLEAGVGENEKRPVEVRGSPHFA